MDTSERNVEAARRGFAAVLRGDVDAISELLDPEVKWHGGDQAAPGACNNREEALAFMRRSEAIRGRRFELVDVVGARDRVVVVMRPRGDGDGDNAEVVANLVTFRNGRAVEIVHYVDARDALAALAAAEV